MKVSFIGEADEWTQCIQIYLKYHENLIGFFKDKDYGDGINEIVFCLVCRSHELKLKQRVRFDHRKKIFYCDIFYNYDYMVNSENMSREIHFFEELRQIIPFLEKRKIKDFDVNAFKSDLNLIISEYI